jgi:predicted O-methyltransferase YrrM
LSCVRLRRKHLSDSFAAWLGPEPADMDFRASLPLTHHGDVLTADADDRLHRVRAVRAALHSAGPRRSRPFGGDFERVALPAADCEVLRDILVAHAAHVVIEVGLAYGSSALAIGEALCSTGATAVSHIVIDPFQATAYDNVGWDALNAAGLAAHTTLIGEASAIALARLVHDGFTADAAFVDGSHRFHEVFVDLYFLRKLVRPGGLIVLDDAAWPSVAAALRYFDLNLGWQPVSIAGRLTARRVPDQPFDPPFTEFKPF